MLFILNFVYFNSSYIVFKVYFFIVSIQTFVVTSYTYVLVKVFAQTNPMIFRVNLKYFQTRDCFLKTLVNTYVTG